MAMSSSRKPKRMSLISGHRETSRTRRMSEAGVQASQTSSAALSALSSVNAKEGMSSQPDLAGHADHVYALLSLFMVANEI